MQMGLSLSGSSKKEIIHMAEDYLRISDQK